MSDKQIIKSWWQSRYKQLSIENLTILFVQMYRGSRFHVSASWFTHLHLVCDSRVGRGGLSYCYQARHGSEWLEKIRKSGKNLVTKYLKILNSTTLQFEKGSNFWLKRFKLHKQICNLILLNWLDLLIYEDKREHFVLAVTPF